MRTILAIAAITWVIGTATPSTLYTYDKEEKAWETFWEHKGCGWDYCPELLKERNPMPVPHHTNFEWGTKEYWHSYCTLIPEKCTY